MRPFRFGISRSRAEDAGQWRAFARRAEDAGYDVLVVADHLGALAPMVALSAAAEATSRVRLGTLVLNNDFRHPAIVAQEAASLDLLSGGRFELGMGAGWNASEYQTSRVRQFDSPSIRVERLEEALIIVRGLLNGDTVTHEGKHYQMKAHRLEPLPPQRAGLPMVVGGNGSRLLRVAARRADVVGFTGFRLRATGPVYEDATEGGLASRIELVRHHAGARFDRMELNVLLQWVEVTDQPDAAAEALSAHWDGAMTPRQMLDSPFLQFGTASAIADRLEDLRDRFGVNYFTVFDGRSSGFDEVMRVLRR